MKKTTDKEKLIRDLASLTPEEFACLLLKLNEMINGQK